MKKFLAIFAAVAVVGTAGYAIVKTEENKADPSSEKESTTYSQVESGSNSAEKTVGDKSNDSSDLDNKNSQTNVSDVSNVIDEKESSFTASISSYSEKMMMVVPDKGTAESKSSDKISIDINNIKLVDEKGKVVKSDDVKNFAKAKITYKGGIQETYPARVNATKIVLTGRVNCNVYFSVNGETVRTLNVGVGGSVEEADMPNAGAYCEDGYHFDGWYVNSERVDGLTNITDSITVVAKISKD